MKLAYVPEARHEQRDAVIRYGRESPAAARRFRSELKAVLARLVATPKQFPTVDSLHRRALLSGFPYQIVFQNLEGIILIVAVANTSRDPAYWQGRT